MSRNSPEAKGSLTRYRVNLLLFAVLTAAATLWFFLHLKLWMEATSLLGGTVSLWALWKLLSSLPSSVTDEAGSLGESFVGESFLGSRAATELLAFLLVLQALLYATTSSIYLTYDAAPGPSEYLVEVKRFGNPYLEPLKIRSQQRVVGRPFFLAGKRELEFRIVQPPGFEPERRTVYPWNPVRLQVPGSFKSRQLATLRVVPGLSLLQRLPKRSDDPETLYSLRVAIGGQTFQLDDLRRECVLLGASGEALEWFAAGQDKDAFRQVLLEYLTRARVPEAKQAQHLVRWQAEARHLATSELKPEDSIKVEIYRAGADQPIASRPVTMKGGAKDHIDTLVLEVD
ncbi:MAG: hypothetical protein AAF560_15340 [Acidobacteriota bacterium]